jgi:hypothetical protein
VPFHVDSGASALNFHQTTKPKPVSHKKTPPMKIISGVFEKT